MGWIHSRLPLPTGWRGSSAAQTGRMQAAAAGREAVRVYRGDEASPTTHASQGLRRRSFSRKITAASASIAAMFTTEVMDFAVRNP
jgi:hypothetical protein